MTPETTPFSQICPECQAEVEVTNDEPLTLVQCTHCGADIVVGEWLGHYQLLTVAGRGGMGVVFKALDTSLDREVALKVLRTDRLSADSLEQLETEAAVTASINHPHVVKVFTTGTIEGRFYLAMELVDCGTLDDLIHIQGRVAEAQVLEVALQVAQGLRAAYLAGLIHRDVKPGNILFADAHTAKIVDFGLAMLEEAAANAAGAEIWGTPYYVAPEKLDKQPEDLRSDIYSLGATLFHALAGRPPFEAEDATMVALKHLKSQAVSLQAFAPWVSGSTAYVINRTLLKNPDERYQDYDELIEHLTYARNELLTQTSTPSSKRVVLETEEDRKLWSYLTFGMVALCLLLGVGFLLFFHRHSGGATPLRAATKLPGPHSAKFDAARKDLLEGNSEGASKEFHEIAQDGSTPKPLLEWAIVHEALGDLLSNHPAEAKAALGELATSSFAAADPSGEEMERFFAALSKAAEGDGAPTPAATQDFKKDDYRAVGLLILGLKAWDAGQFDDAGPLLRAFESTTLSGEASWVAAYKTLASDYLADFTDYRGAMALAKSAHSAADRSRARTALQRLKGELRRGQGLAARIDAELGALGNPGARQVKAINDARDALGDLCQSWRLPEARDLVLKLDATDDLPRREKAALLRKVDWLIAFKKQLIADLAGKGAKTPLKTADRATLPAAAKGADENGVQLANGQSVEWKALAPASVLDLARQLIHDAPAGAQAARRAWLAGVYALLIKDGASARALLAEAATAAPDAAERLPALLPDVPFNVARARDATASGSLQDDTHTETPDRAVDGSTATKWCAVNGSPQWLAVDLRKPQSVTKWVVKHAQAGGEPPEMNTRDFALEKSADGQAWSNVDSVTGNTGAITSRDVAAFSARYLRLLVTKPSQGADPSARVLEFELYGPGAKEIPDLFSPVQLAGAPRLTGINLSLPADAASGDSAFEAATGMFTIHAAGADLFGKADGGRYLSRPAAGNVEMIAYVRSIQRTDDWAKCGLMLRESAAPDARNACIVASAANGVEFQTRKEPGAETSSVINGSFPVPCWLKLVRQGDVVTGFASQDGITWTQVGNPETVALGAQPSAGIAATSHKEGALSESTIDEVQITSEP